MLGSDGAGSKFFDPSRINFLWLGSGQPFMVWVWKISPKNVKFFNFYPLGQKNLFGLSQKVPGSKVDQPLIYCGSKVSSGQGPSLMLGAVCLTIFMTIPSDPVLIFPL